MNELLDQKRKSTGKPVGTGSVTDEKGPLLEMKKIQESYFLSRQIIQQSYYSQIRISMYSQWSDFRVRHNIFGGRSI